MFRLLPHLAVLAMATVLVPPSTRRPDVRVCADEPVQVEPLRWSEPFPEPLRTAALHLGVADETALDSHTYLGAEEALQWLMLGETAEGRRAAFPDTSDLELARYDEVLALAEALSMAWPVHEYDVPVSDYGWRVDPFDHAKDNFHGGIDFAVEPGTKVYAPQDGTMYSGFDPNGGYWIITEHGSRVSTLYCHLKRHVRTRGDIKKGDLIAISGNSGISTGPHLHWSVRIGRKTVDPKQIIGPWPGNDPQ